MCNKGICATWPWVTVMQQKKFVPILTHGYLLSNKVYMTSLGMGPSRVTIAHVIAIVYQNIVTCL